MSASSVIFDRLVTLGIGEEGTSAFEHFMPETATGALVKEVLDGNQVDHEILGKRTGRFQIVTRDRDPQAAYALAMRVFKELGVLEADIGDLYFNYLRPIAEPIPFQRSEGGYHEYLVIFSARWIDD